VVDIPPSTFRFSQGAASTYFWIDPKENLFVVFMTQVLQQDRLRMPIRKKLQNLVYGALTDGRPFVPPSTQVDARL
jgi:CubicO group peptidase (beta-lactamase class C family)